MQLWHSDTLTLMSAVLAGGVAVFGGLFSVNVFAHEGKAGAIAPERRSFARMLVGALVLGAALALFAAPMWLWWIGVVGMEATLVASLMLYTRNNSREVMMKYVVRGAIAVGVILLALCVMYGLALSAGIHSFSSATGAALASVLGAGWKLGLLKYAFVLVVFGVGMIIGIAPMSVGLSDLYSKVPSPIAAIALPLLSFTGMIELIRVREVFDVILGDDGAWTGRVFIVFGAFTVVAMALAVRKEHNYKIFFSRLVFAHIGLTLFFAGIGIAGTIPALMQLSGVALASCALFGVAGILHATYKTTKQTGIRNMRMLLPWCAGVLTFVMLSLVFLPLSGVFMSAMIGLGYGVQLHPVSTSVVLVGFVVLGWASIRFLLGMVLHKEEDALALTPVLWRTSTIALCVLCASLVFAGWYFGTQNGVRFFVELAQDVTSL